MESDILRKDKRKIRCRVTLNLDMNSRRSLKKKRMMKKCDTRRGIKKRERDSRRMKKG